MATIYFFVARLLVINWNQTHSLCLGKFLYYKISREKFEPEPEFRDSVAPVGAVSHRFSFLNLFLLLLSLFLSLSLLVLLLLLFVGLNFVLIVIVMIISIVIITTTIVVVVVLCETMCIWNTPSPLIVVSSQWTIPNTYCFKQRTQSISLNPLPMYTEVTNCLSGKISGFHYQRVYPRFLWVTNFRRILKKSIAFQIHYHQYL